MKCVRLEHSEGKQLEERHASWDATVAGTLEALAAVHSGSQDAAAQAIH